MKPIPKLWKLHLVSKVKNTLQNNPETRSVARDLYYKRSDCIRATCRLCPFIIADTLIHCYINRDIIHHYGHSFDDRPDCIVELLHPLRRYFL